MCGIQWTIITLQNAVLEKVDKVYAWTYKKASLNLKDCLSIIVVVKIN